MGGNANLVFLFLILLHFPTSKSIASIIKERYGCEILKLIRKFEKVDFKFKKAIIDLDFLYYCRNNNLIPTFLKFKSANKVLANSDVYKSCQLKVLAVEIEEKKRAINEHKNHHYKLMIEIKQQVNPIDFAHISLIFLICYGKNIQKWKEVQYCKILKLGKNSLSRSNPNKVIYNFSSVTLSDSDKSLLSKSLNFACHTLLWNIWNIWLIMNCFSETLNLDTSHLDCELLKSRLKNLVFSSFKTYVSSRTPNFLTPEESESLLKLIKNKNVIQKSDKGNSFILIDKIVYTNGIRKLSDNLRQFKKLSIDLSKELKFIFNCEQKVSDILKEIKKKQINEDLCKKLHPVGSQPEVLYCLAKVHKKVIDGCLAFQSILSVIGTPIYKIAKFLVPILKDLNSN